MNHKAHSIQKAHARVNVTSQDVASISERATATACGKVDDGDCCKDVSDFL